MLEYYEQPPSLKQGIDKLYAANLLSSQIDKLVALREKYSTGQITELTVEEQRLSFARWLRLSGRIYDGPPTCTISQFLDTLDTSALGREPEEITGKTIQKRHKEFDQWIKQHSERVNHRPLYSPDFSLDQRCKLQAARQKYQRGELNESTLEPRRQEFAKWLRLNGRISG